MSQASTIPELVAKLSKLLREQNRTLATVESCTGGMVGAAITEPAGASKVFVGGYITYSEEQKIRAVNVSADTLEEYGVYSSQVAIEMAEGGCKQAQASIAVSLTGVAGTGQTEPMGTVWICVAFHAGWHDCRQFLFPDDEGRTAIRTRSTISALEMCIQMLNNGYHTLDHECERLTA